MAADLETSNLNASGVDTSTEMTFGRDRNMDNLILGVGLNIGNLDSNKFSFDNSTNRSAAEFDVRGQGPAGVEARAQGSSPDTHHLRAHGNIYQGQNMTIGGISGGDNSVDLLTTIDGDNSSYFASKRFHSMQLEQKDDVIDQLKAQIELLESERDNKWKR